MYSFRIQLFTAVLFAVLSGIISYYFYPISLFLSLICGAGGLIISYGILYFFVHRPLRLIQRVIDAQKDKSSVHRVNLYTSDELRNMSDSFNTMLDSFRADIVQLEKLEHVRSEFLGNVSHELRTPLFTTQGLIETLLHGAVDDKKVNRDFLQKALNNIERLNLLLEELIDISRIESGEMKLRLRFFDIVPLLVDTVNDEQVHAGQKNITLKLSGETGLPIEVFGDRERIRQVLVNLIENAIKYSELEGTITVKFVELRDSVELSVEDTGIGIAPQHLPRIFERFYRVDKDRSRDVGGSGLGLAIVKHIVEAHDSTISVESNVGVGTKFTFTVKKSGVS
ncbi:MAG: ATP-binding protein [Bacteroidota bacterium]|nr:ATP-binding protein [Bacteroidota bacterium]